MSLPSQKVAAKPFHDESVPAVPGASPGHPLVVFGDHRFCAGESLDVMRMAGPHMHSQVELNFVLEGAMTYWFDGRRLTVSQGRLALFWGMIPHQVVDIAEPTRFVCLYIPMSVFLGLPSLSRFRDAVFRGAMIEAMEIRPFDREIFLRWREELLSGDASLEQIVRDEVTARVRRLDREGWRDLRAVGSAIALPDRHEAERRLPDREDGSLHQRTCTGGDFGSRRGALGRPASELCDDAVQAGDRSDDRPGDRAPAPRHGAVAAYRNRHAGHDDRVRIRFRLAVAILRSVRTSFRDEAECIPQDAGEVIVTRGDVVKMRQLPHATYGPNGRSLASIVPLRLYCSGSVSLGWSLRPSGIRTLS